MDQTVGIALPKGRLGDKVYNMFEEAGYGCPEIHDPGRKLIFDSQDGAVSFFFVKPSDVAIYVERGAADIGIAGKDILLEYSPDVYELLDLGIGRCRMCVCGKPDSYGDADRTLKVATKFTNIAKDYYSSISRDIDIIHLNGSIELAPLLGLSDVIVDIVETGATLRENGLTELETIVDISARLVANKVSYKFKYEPITRIARKLSELVQSRI